MALKQKTVYFREEDLPKWQAIKNKAEWLHEHLNYYHVKDGELLIVDTENIKYTLLTPNSEDTA